MTNKLKWMMVRYMTDIVVVVLSIGVFYLEFQLPYNTDLTDHLAIVQSIIKGNVMYPPHFLYYGLIVMLSDVLHPVWATILILSVSVLFKKFLTEKILYFVISGGTIKNSLGYSFVQYFIPVLSLVFILFTNLPSKPPFLLPWPPITWINSTLIFVFPVCLLFFLLSACLISDFRKRYLVYSIVLGIFILFSKPNYILVTIFSLPISILIIQKDKRFFMYSLWFSASMLLLLGWQYYYTYYMVGKQTNIQYSDVHVVFRPFSAWSRVSSNIFLSALLWFSFPLCVWVFYFKKLLREPVYFYALVSFITGLIIFIMFEEVKSNNHPLGSCNFMWQVFITLYILSVISLGYQIRYIQEKQKIHWYDGFIWLVFVYHALAGIMYLYNTVFSHFL